MEKSFKEYITALGHWGWVVLMDIISGGAGAYLDISGTWGFPTWLWLLLLVIAFIIVPFIAFHKLRVQRDKLDIKTAKLELSTPRPLPNPQEVFVRMADGAGERLLVNVWQVELTNEQTNSEAKDIRVKIARSRPILDFLPVDLHKMHDNTLPYTKYHNMVYGDCIWFDVIGMDKNNNELCLFRSDVQDDCVSQMPYKLYSIDMHEGILLEITARASPPNKDAERWYRAYIDTSGEFKLVDYEDTNS